MAREIVLDTETTGIDHKNGHRLIEVGCIELDGFLPTGNTFHRFIDPERLIEPDAIRVHGITDDMVKGQPKFAEIAADMLKFVGGSPIIAHNAAFDRGFINMELGRLNLTIIDEPQWIDTLEMARNKFPGMHNSLDALCKRFNISLQERDKHGALIDARLLASVYLELHGGKERGLDLDSHSNSLDASGHAIVRDYGPRPRPLPSRITPAEAEAHQAFVAKHLKEKSLW